MRFIKIDTLLMGNLFEDQTSKNGGGGLRASIL